MHEVAFIDAYGSMVLKWNGEQSIQLYYYCV